MRRAAILGMSQVSAVGAGLDALRRALTGKLPEPQWLPCGLGADEMKVPVLCASVRGVEKLTEPRGLRRLDAFAQRTLYAALLALKDCQAGTIDPERVGVIVATGRGPISTGFAFLDETIERGDGLSSPIVFANSVHGAAAAAISSTLGLRGPMLTVAGFTSPWSEALALALDWLARSMADRVLLASGDEFHRVAGYAAQRSGGHADDGRLRPLALERCTFVPGETFSAFVLARDDAQPSCGHLCEPRLFKDALAADGAPLFLAAQGDRREGAAYLSVAREASAVAAYSSLWGANPTSDALNVMVAALSLRDRRFYSVPESDSCTAGLSLLKADVAGVPSAIRCVSMDATGAGVLVGVE